MSKHVLTALCVVIASALPAHGAEPRRFEFSEPHMGTQFKIILYAEDEQTARAAARRSLAATTARGGARRSLAATAGAALMMAGLAPVS